MSSGENHGNRMEDDYECTVPFDDTDVHETEVMSVADSVKNERTQLLDDHEGEIVVDSDDEGVDGTEEAMKGLSCYKIEKRPQPRTGYLWRNGRKDFRQSARPINVERCPFTDGESKADPYPISAVANFQEQIFSTEYIVARAETQVDLSNKVVNMENERLNQNEEVSSGMKQIESNDTVKEILSKDEVRENKVASTNSEATIVTSDHELARLSYIESQEPEESSPSNALNPVDRYLSANNLNLPDEDSTRTTKANRTISPPLLNAKGPRRLARRANLRTAMESGAFDWDEEQTEKGECLALRKGKQLIPGCKGYVSGTITIHQDSDYSDFQKSLDVRSDKNPPGNMLSMEKPDPKMMAEVDTEKVPVISEMIVGTNVAKELVGDLDVGSSGLQLEHDRHGRDVADWLDVGFETQLAAEAMEALVRAPPNNKASYAHQGSSDIIETSSEVAAMNKRSGNGTYFNSILSNSIVTRRRSKSIRRSATKLKENVTCSLGKCDQHQKESISCLAAKKKGNGNGPLTERNLVDTKDKVHRRFCRNKSEERKKPPEKNKFKKVVGDHTSSKSNKSNSHHGGLLGGNFWNLSVAAKRKRCQPSYSSLGSSLDPTEHSEETFDHIMEFDVSKKRKVASNSSNDVQKKLKTKWNYSKLVSDTSLEDTESNKLEVQICPDTIGTACQLKLDCWSYLKKKRTPVSFKCYSNGSNRQFTPLEAVDEKYKIHPTGNNKSVERFACPLLVHTRRLKSILEKKGSETLSKQNTTAQSSPGVNNSAFSVASRCIIPAKLGKVKSSKHSGALDKVTSLHTIRNSENMKFNQGSKDDSTAPSNYKSNEKCKLTGKNKSKSPLMKELSLLGYAESLPDFMLKGSRRRRGDANVCILFSQNLEATIVRKQKKILARLGFSEASSCFDATHFIADKFARTRNMLEAIALGKPVVTPSWLESCGQAGYLIDEKSYILRDAKKEKEIGFCMPVALARARQHPLLHGQRVLITPNVKPNKDLIQSLVKAVHGEAVQEIRQAEVKYDTISQDILILSCEEDYAMCVPFLDKGTAVYSSELLLNGIITQKLQYKRHQLFTDYAEKNSLALEENKISLA